MHILLSKSHFNRNLLHVAANCSSNVESHKVLWTIYQKFLKSDQQFLDIFKEVDDLSRNVFHIAAASSTNEVFNFMIEELEKLTTNNKIKIFLSSFCDKRTNLRQLAAKENKSLEFLSFYGN
ncbi:hypothetical protein ACKWTF_015382 [Chironomus riparius]